MGRIDGLCIGMNYKQRQVGAETRRMDRLCIGMNYKQRHSSIAKVEGDGIGCKGTKFRIKKDTIDGSRYSRHIDTAVTIDPSVNTSPPRIPQVQTCPP